MKNLFALCLLAVVVSGCQTPPRFNDYSGTEIRHGAGGSYRFIEDIELWETGAPSRTYQLLGTIDDGIKVNRFNFLADEESILAKIAHQRGADAVLILEKEAVATTPDEDNPLPPKIKKAAFIKYVN